MTKLLWAPLFTLAPAVAQAEAFDCKLTGLAQGQPIREVSLRPPSQAQIETELAEGKFLLRIWSYGASVGVEIDRLPAKTAELTTQMTIESGGILDLTYKPADLRLTCIEAQ